MIQMVGKRAPRKRKSTREGWRKKGAKEIAGGAQAQRQEKIDYENVIQRNNNSGFSTSAVFKNSLARSQIPARLR
jgi:hypothetical protein